MTELQQLQGYQVHIAVEDTMVTIKRIYLLGHLKPIKWKEWVFQKLASRKQSAAMKRHYTDLSVLQQGATWTDMCKNFYMQEQQKGQVRQCLLSKFFCLCCTCLVFQVKSFSITCILFLMENSSGDKAMARPPERKWIPA